MKKTNTILKIVAICVICAATLMSGCVETTTTDEFGTYKYNVLTEETVADVDYYEDSLHITGTAVYDGEEMVSMNVNVDGYVDGIKVTGTVSQHRDDLPHYTVKYTLDEYEDGLHFTGDASFSGQSKDFPDFDDPRWRMDCNVGGYIDGNHVTGTMYVAAGETCYDWYMKVDTYRSDGAHSIGYGTLKGCGDDIEWYRCLTATKDGYKTQYLNGYNDAEWRYN